MLVLASKDASTAHGIRRETGVPRAPNDPHTVDSCLPVHWHQSAQDEGTETDQSGCIALQTNTDAGCSNAGKARWIRPRPCVAAL